MKKNVIACLSLFIIGSACHHANNNGQALSSNLIFDEDNRADVYQSSLRHQNWARSTAGMFPREELKEFMAGKPMPTLLEYGVNIYHDGSDYPSREKVCPDMKFANQPVGAHCAGFLVAPDLLVTAGHCVPTFNSCDAYEWVFDYKIDRNGKVRLKEKNIYKCKEVVDTKLFYGTPLYDPQEELEHQNCLQMFGGGGYGGTWAMSHCPEPKPISWDYSEEADYALIRLDRKVKGRRPLKVRTEGSIEVGENVITIGHPLGVPNKITTEGVVMDASYAHSFTINLDSLKGNSGGVVINADSGEVEGILVQGGTKHFEYDEQRECYNIRYYDGQDPMSSMTEEELEDLTLKDIYTGVQKITSIDALMEILSDE